MNYTFFRRAFWCASLLTLILPASAAPLTLSQVLARHRQASETATGRKEKGAHEIVYAISAGGLDGTLTVYEAPPHRSRSEIRLGPLAINTGSDGKTTWEQDGNGNVRILSGEELAENNADSGFSLESVDPLKKGNAVSMTLRPGRDPETGCYVLDAQPKGGTQQTIYLDAKTFLVRKSVVRKGGIVSTISILAYQPEFGTQTPSHLQIQPGGLPLVIDATLREATRLTNVAATLFTPPTPPKDWEFLTPGATKSVSFPFVANDNEVVVFVAVNGHPLRFLLDSGAAGAFITEPAAVTAGLTTQGNLPALGYGGSSATGLAAETTLEIGGAVRLSRLTLHVIKDPAIAKLLSGRGRVDGAVGYEVLARFITQIDYANKTVTLTDPSVPSAALDAQTVTLPLKLEARMPTVLASIDGRAPARFLVDTGDAGGVHLYTQYAQANGLLPRPNDPHAQTRMGIGVGGTMQETITLGHTLSLGRLKLRDLGVATMTGPGITQVSTHAGGIGNLALRHFQVTFDYPHSQMRLSPASPEPTPLTSSPPPETGWERGKVTGLVQNSSPSRFGRGSEPKRAGWVPGPRLLLAADVSAPAANAVPMTLETLLQRHLEALGGADALTAIKNTKVVSTVQTGGIQGTITTIYAAPDKEYEEDKLGILDITQGYDGKSAWQRDTNGNVRPLAGEELKDLRVQLFFDTNSYVLPGRIHGKLTLRPETEPETGNFIVDAFPEGGKQSTLFFDPHTFFIVKEQHLDDNVLVTTTYGDYRTIDNARFPFQMTTTNGTPRYDILGTVTQVQNNIALPPDLFSPPTGGKKFRFIASGKTRATVPFDMDDGEIGLSVKINGQPERVFLDSGASGIALSQQVATQLGLKSSGFLEARGYGGSADLHPILVNHFEVPGAVELTDIAAISIDLPDSLNAYFTRPLAGFVGYDLLAHFVVQVDFPHRKLTFIQPDAFHPTVQDGKPLALELDNDVPSVEAKLDALPIQRFLIDTGDEAALRLYSPFVAQYGLDKKYPHGLLTTGGGIGGASRSRVTRIGSLNVAGVTLRGVPADFSLDPKGGASLVNAGSLGASFLSRFVVTFDYPHSRVFFAPTAKTRAPFVTETTGLTLMETKDPQGHAHVVVAEIQPRSPALRAGLNTFDEVLAIDGQQTARLGLTGARHLLSPLS
ncbi:MAG: aspartyl protease family protein, partial [Armatimonadota bacterium]|nr:aspartyl protease family protein [Armatimonadota bacterium]